jgi:hypothetical protein
MTSTKRLQRRPWQASRVLLWGSPSWSQSLRSGWQKVRCICRPQSKVLVHTRQGPTLGLHLALVQLSVAKCCLQPHLHVCGSWLGVRMHH